MSLNEDFRQALENDRAASLDRIEARRCSSDNYSGVQYNFYGYFIPVRPIIDVVAEADGRAIEELQFSDDGEPFLGMFVAELPTQSHPAFIDT